MPGLSNWREEFNLSEVVTGKMTDKEALKKVSEKSGINNKVTINPKLDEAVKEIGGEVIGMVEQDTTAQKQRIDMKQMILDRQKLKIRRKDLSAAKKEQQNDVEGDSTNASKQSNVIAQEDKNWIQKATKNMRKDKPCTGEKFGSESCPPGSKRYNLAKTFRKMAKEETEVKEGVMKMVKRVISKKKPEKKAQKAMDAGAIARRKLQQKDHEKVNFLPMNEQKDAYKYVVSKLRKKYGDGVLTKGDKIKPPTAAQKKAAAAHQAKVDKENAAERAKDPSQGRYPKGYSNRGSD